MVAQKTHPRQVKDVMTREVVALRPQQPFVQALALLARHRFRHLLVTDAHAHLAGVISDRDLLRFMSRGDRPRSGHGRRGDGPCRGHRSTRNLTVRSRDPDAEPSY